MKQLNWAHFYQKGKGKKVEVRIAKDCRISNCRKTHRQDWRHPEIVSKPVAMHFSIILGIFLRLHIYISQPDLPACCQPTTQNTFATTNSPHAHHQLPPRTPPNPPTHTHSHTLTPHCQHHLDQPWPRQIRVILICSIKHPSKIPSFDGDSRWGYVNAPKCLQSNCIVWCDIFRKFHHPQINCFKVLHQKTWYPSNVFS